MGIFSRLFHRKQAQNQEPVNPGNVTGIQATPPSEPQITKKLKIEAKDLNFNDVIGRYASAAHHSSPSAYNYYEYHRAEFECLLHGIQRAKIDLKDEKVLRSKEIRTPFEKSAPITKKTPVKKLKNFVVIDTETTGLKVGGNDIIEVSAIKFENFVPVSIFSTLLKPRKPIPTDASDVSGITDDMVAESPKFSQIKSALSDFIGGLPLVAHNAAFDVKFLYVSGLDFPENQIFYDTLELSRRSIKDYSGAKLDSYKLSDVCAECCIYFDGSHRASADALATGLLFMEIIRSVREVDSLFDL